MALVLLNLDLTVVNLALPVLGKNFHASLSLLQWVNNIYSLTFAALVMLAGKLADRYGHRLIYLYGVSFFFLGSLVGGVAPNIFVLIIGRLLQGVGMAGTFGMVFILANAAFPPEKRSYAVGLLVVFVGVAQAIGPTFGGFIVGHCGWQYAFLINLPFCIISFVLVRWACSANTAQSSSSIHYISGSLFILAFFVLVGAFNEVAQWGLSSNLFLTAFALGVLLYFSAMLWQRKLSEPFFDLKLFENKVYRLTNFIRPLFQFNFGAFFFILPLYLQNIAGMSPSKAGLIMLIMTIPLAISSYITGKLNAKLHHKKTLLVAHLAALFGYVIFALAPIAPINWLLFSFALILIGINVGMMYSTTNFIVIKNLPDNKKGVGFGFFSANAYFFYSIGVAIAGSLVTTIAMNHFHDLVSHSNMAGQSFAIQSYVNGARPVSDMTQLYPAHATQLLNFAMDSFARGFATVMWIFASFSILGLCLSCCV